MSNIDLYFSEFKKRLQNDVIDFCYTKKNGDIREARGTLKIDIIEEAGALPKGTMDPNVNDNICRYWDCNSQAWRSFDINRLNYYMYNDKKFVYSI